MTTFENMIGSRDGQEQMRTEIILSEIDELSTEIRRSAERASEITKKLTEGSLTTEEEETLGHELEEEIQRGWQAAQERIQLFRKYGSPTSQ